MITRPIGMMIGPTAARPVGGQDRDRAAGCAAYQIGDEQIETGLAVTA